MKRIITLAAIIMAAAIPIAASAQTFSYYGYDNPEKTEFISIIEDAINAGTVTFDTQAHKNEFLALISDLYDARDAENWGECADLAEQLQTASNYIVGNQIKILVGFLCETTADAYNSPNHILQITPNDYDDTHDILMGAPIGNKEPLARKKIHVTETSSEECTYWLGSKGKLYHTGVCDYVIITGRRLM
ncbi:hypothetical protein GX441_09665 [bacterium]|nr:hypothetical protein [bacterium]